MTPIGHISSAPQDHGTTILAPMFNGTPNASYESLKFFRPRASPRSTPASTARSSLSLDIPSGEVEADALSSGEQSPIRGRTLLGGHARDNWCSWATSRRQTGLSSIDIGSGLLRRRLLSKDFTTEPEEFDNSVVESLPFERFRSSLSEELHRAATFDSSIDLTKFGGHRDTFAVVGLRRLRNSPSDLPNLFYETLLPYIDFKTYQALRLSCQAWSAAVTRARPVVLPSVCMLPAEILEKIYRYVIPEKKWEQKLDVVQKYLFLHCHCYLSPLDFNAARHTCRAWMITSLEENMLTLMLKRGGWWNAAQADAARQEEIDGTIAGEWLLSKRLATECSLLAGWTGDGLSRCVSSPTSLALTSQTDFTKLIPSYRTSSHGHEKTALHFTVSDCNHFLLIAEDCVIYVYSLTDTSYTSLHHYGGHLRLFTSVSCPGRVLAVSMDTSSDRFAVAALLEGRVGVVWDLYESRPNARHKTTYPRVSSIAQTNRASVFSSCSSGERVVMDSVGCSNFSAASSHQPNEQTLPRPELHRGNSERSTWPIGNSALPVETTGSHGLGCQCSTTTGLQQAGPRSIYHNLCSSDDPPRSVAICPQRRCVAFGCAAGIELHWLDALSGQDLNRWFPLTAPSDFLYFLPPRPGIDSVRKLRLISSAAHPNERPGAGDYEVGRSNPSWNEEVSDLRTRYGGWNSSDHYQAIPISNGWNVIFSVPEAGRLCLGSDSPPSPGATKLLRKFELVGPKGLVPRVYAAGRELRWGIRVAVGFGEGLWLFCLPGDLFHEKERKKENMKEEWRAETTPTRIEGVQIGTVPGLVGIAVDTLGGDLTIWAFSTLGQAFVWQIRVGGQGSIRRRFLREDGSVNISEDGMWSWDAERDVDGDVIMKDAPQVSRDLDGPSSVPQSVPGSSSLVGERGGMDANGDVEMPDVPTPSPSPWDQSYTDHEHEFEDEGYASDSEIPTDTSNTPTDTDYAQAINPFAIHVPPLRERWSGDDVEWIPDYLRANGVGIEDEGLGVDVVEMCRVECEILCDSGVMEGWGQGGTGW